MVNDTSKVIKIFFSYVHEDEHWREELEKQLRPLQLQGVVEFLHDRSIQPGQQWRQKLNSYLESADVILLLISPDFMASDYCFQVEGTRAMERYAAGQAYVIPIILRPTNWQETPFGNLSALPADAKPAALWDNRDLATLDIVAGIQKVVRQLLLGASPNSIKVDGSTQNQTGQAKEQEAMMPKQFSQFQRNRQEQKRDILQSEWNIHSERIKRLREALGIETRPEEIFRLQHLVSKEEEALTRLGKELDTIEQSLQ